MSEVVAPGALMPQALALAMICIALASAVLAIGTRSLLVIGLSTSAAGAASVGALMALGAGQAALPLSLIACALAPILFMAALLLGGRVAKARRSRMVFVAGAAMCAMIVAGIVSVSSELTQTTAPAAMNNSGGAVWLAPLLFVCGALCVALLGFGERGALEPHGPEREE